MEDALQLTALGAICNLLREEEGGTGAESEAPEGFGKSTPEAVQPSSAKYSAAGASGVPPISPAVGGGRAPRRSGGSGADDFDALWRNESIRRAQKQLQGQAGATALLSLSDLNSIMGDTDEGALAQVLPAQRYALGNPRPGAVGVEMDVDPSGSPMPSPDDMEAWREEEEEGDPVEASGLQLREELSSLQHSLATSMGAIGAVGDTLRRLTEGLEVPREYRHMAHWVGGRVAGAPVIG